MLRNVQGLMTKISRLFYSGRLDETHFYSHFFAGRSVPGSITKQAVEKLNFQQPAA